MTEVNSNGFNIDALLPPDMALKAEQIGVKKAQIGFYTMFALSVLAGAFISLGAIFFTTITAGAADKMPFGMIRLVGGLGFSLGLILVIIGGAELFTGNNLIVMAWASGKVSTGQLLHNWLIVYLGNFAGSLATAVLMFLTRQYTFGGGAVGANALAIASAKSSLDPVQAVFLGIMCNTLVCLAVWMSFSARSTTDKVYSILFPITAFVAVGFEHSVANMYFVPIGLLIKAYGSASFWTAIGKTPADFPKITWGNFLTNNLLPVTIGNIIGGAFMVGAVYWFVYLRKKRSAASPVMPLAKQQGTD